MMPIERGTQVVCINPECKFPVDKHGNRWPRFREVLTVRAIIQDQASGTTGLLFEEIINEPKPTFPIGVLKEMGFNIRFFRPARRTDIAIFKRILENRPKLELVQ